jgi:hypothetical protein
MRFLIIILFLITCKIQSNQDLQSIADQIVRKNIVVVLVDRKKAMSVEGKLLFREKLIYLTNILKKNHPSEIFLNYKFIDNIGDLRQFADRLNEKIKTISLMESIHNEELNKIELNHVNKLGMSKFPNEFNEKNINFFEISGILLPSPEIINQSKAICSNIVAADSKDRHFGIVTHVIYNNSLIKTCPIIVYNYLLAENSIELDYDFNLRSPAIIDKLNGKTIALLPYVNNKEIDYIPIDFMDINVIDENELKDKINIIRKDSLFIIGDKDDLRKAINGKSLPSSVIFASQIKTLLNLTSQILKNKINDDSRPAPPSR